MSTATADAATVFFLAACWCAIAAVLVLVKRARRAGNRLVLGGMLIIMTAGIIDRFAAWRNWPHGDLLVADAVTLLIGLVGCGCALLGSYRISQKSGGADTHTNGANQ